jgi:metal-sulfur cluster biosynthetic enzyme
MFTDEQLTEALKDCYIPALRRDVVSAGLVRSASVSIDREAPGTGVAGVPARHVVQVTLSAPGNDDAVNAQLRAAVENRLLGIPEVSRAEITLQPALFPILSRH